MPASLVDIKEIHLNSITDPYQNPFKPKITRLKNLSFHPSMPQPTRNHGTDPRKFLKSELPTQPIKPSTKEQQAFLYRDRLYTLYEKLARHDVDRLTHPHLSTSTNQHFDPIRLAQSSNFAFLARTRPILSSVLAMEFAKWIQEDSEEGATLNLLCEEFGPGCFFLLADHLDSGLLRNKLAQEPKYLNEAFAHLRGLNLPKKVKEGDVGQLGKNIRQYLVKPFREALGEGFKPVGWT